MRALIHDMLGWNSGTDQSSIAKITAVQLPGDYLQRDLWFWVTKDSGAYPGTEVIKVYVYQTQDDAQADTNVVAQNENVTAEGETTVTFSNGATPPDMSTLTVTMVIVASSDAISQIYGYTCQVGVLATDYLVTLLGEYTGTGESLSDINTAHIFGHIVDVWNHTALPAIYVSAGATESPAGVTSAHMAQIPIEVRAYTQSLTSPTQAFKDGRGLQERLASIVFDEQRTLYGIVLDMIFVSMTPPRVVSSNASTYFVESSLVAKANFPLLRHDKGV